jgi:hypothetical protein
MEAEEEDILDDMTERARRRASGADSTLPTLRKRETSLTITVESKERS